MKVKQIQAGIIVQQQREKAPLPQYAASQSTSVWGNRSDFLLWSCQNIDFSLAKWTLAPRVLSLGGLNFSSIQNGKLLEKSNILVR